MKPVSIASPTAALGLRLWYNWNGQNQEPDGDITALMRQTGNPRLTVWVATEVMNRVKNRFGVPRPGGPPSFLHSLRRVIFFFEKARMLWEKGTQYLIR